MLSDVDKMMGFPVCPGKRFEFCVIKIYVKMDVIYLHTISVRAACLSVFFFFFSSSSFLMLAGYGKGES